MTATSEDDLYFEMEFGGDKEEEDETFCSKSVESLSDISGDYHPDQRRGSSVGPILERPNYLRLSSRLKQEGLRTGWSSLSLPRNSPFSQTPRLRSVPSTPSEPGSWEPVHHQATDSHFLRKREFTSSSSSVEDSASNNGSFVKKTRSRLSLNLSLFDESPIKSPNLLPKFLRASFNKLLLRDRARTPETDRVIENNEPLSLPPLSSPNKDLFKNKENDEINSTCDSLKTPPTSNDTKKFVKESVEKGLPLIPFPLPMFMIAENHIANKKQNSKDSEKRRNSVLDINESISLKSHSKNLNKRTNFESDVEEELRKKSLDKLVNEAKHELEQETLKKKIFCIRGYAANNSRALFRRRSSTTDYVGLNQENDIRQVNTAISKNLTDMLETDEVDCLDDQFNESKNHRRAMQDEKDYLDMNCGAK